MPTDKDQKRVNVKETWMGSAYMLFIKFSEKRINWISEILHRDKERIYWDDKGSIWFEDKNSKIRDKETKAG